MWRIRNACSDPRVRLSSASVGHNIPSSSDGGGCGGGGGDGGVAKAVAGDVSSELGERQLVAISYPRRERDKVARNLTIRYPPNKPFVLRRKEVNDLCQYLRLLLGSS